MDSNTFFENLHFQSAPTQSQAAASLMKLRPLLKKIGITRVANITGLDTLGIPVALSVRPLAKNISVSQGKGLTHELAQISAIMESLEGYHAENPRPPELFGTYYELAQNYSLANPNLFSAGFYQMPDLSQWRLGWIGSWDLLQQQNVYLPHALIIFDTTSHHDNYHYFKVSSNGLAAGNSLEEAICHGLYELIERNCLYQWRQLATEERAKTNIKLATIDCPVNQALIRQLTVANVEVMIFDMTSSLGIPTFHCNIIDRDSMRKLPSFQGSGAHISKTIALLRAITEAAQTRLTLISGSRDDVFAAYYQVPSNNAARPWPSISSAWMQETADETTTINLLVNKLQSAGFAQVLVVNHSKPELQIPVVHIFIPGMRF